MATTFCKQRLLSIADTRRYLDAFGLDSFKYELKGARIVDVYGQIGTVSSSITELAAPNTELDGTTTSVLLDVKSTSANDTDAANGHLRTVKLIGWGTGSSTSGTLVPQEEDVALNGITAVQTTKYWTRLMHFYGLTWGSGGADAAGTIVISDTAAAYAAEKTTITATNALLLSDNDWFQFSDFNNATQASTRFNMWLDKSTGGSAPSLDGTEVEVAIDGTEAAQVVTVTAKAPGAAEVSTIVAKAPGVAEIDTVVAVAPGAKEVSTIVAKDFGTAEVSTIVAKAFGTAEISTIVADTFANCQDGTYINLWGIDATFTDKAYYVWLDKVGDDTGDPAPGGKTEIDCDISGDVTAQNVSDTITAAINAQGDFGAANGGGTSTTVTITNTRKGDSTNIADVDTGLACSTTTPGVTNMPNGSYLNLYGTNATFGETTYYVWFDKVGDDAADPAPGGTGIDCNISADVTDQNISDTITAAINAQGDFGAANGGGTSTTVTITNARKGANTDIVDVDSTLTVATTTPGVTNIPNGGYFVLYGMVAATKVQKGYYVWFDKVGDDAADPAPGGGLTAIDCDISADVTAQDISDTITAAINGVADFGAANGATTTTTVTNATIGVTTDVADVDTTLTLATTVPGTNVIVDGTYFTFEALNATTKAAVKYYVWFDWIGDLSADPAPATYTRVTCDISADVTAQNVSDCIATAINAVTEVSAANGAGLTTTVTHGTLGAVTDMADVDSGLAITVTTPGVTNITDGSYLMLYGVDSTTKAETTYYVWFDWVGDDSADPAPGGTEIAVDISADVTDQNVSDAIAAAINAVGDFGAANSGGLTTTVTNATIGVCTDIVDTGSTGLTIATTTPGTNVIGDGTYFTLNGINGSGVDTAYYVWFDWIGDSSGDPAPGGTELRIDISADTSIKDVAEAIQPIINADSLFSATEDDTDVVITNANNGDCTNAADVDTTLTIANTTPGGSTATQVATAFVTAINGSAALVTAAETSYPEFTITNTNPGPVSASADGSAATNFTFVRTTTGAGSSTMYLNIPAGNNESNGSRIYVPDEYYSIVKRIMVKPTIDLGDNTTVITLTRVAFDNTGNTDPDMEAEQFTIWDLNPMIDQVGEHFPRKGTDDAYYKISEHYTTASAATDVRLLVIFSK
jgi:hypothetical protein